MRQFKASIEVDLNCIIAQGQLNVEKANLK